MHLRFTKYPVCVYIYTLALEFLSCKLVPIFQVLSVKDTFVNLMSPPYSSFSDQIPSNPWRSTVIILLMDNDNKLAVKCVFRRHENGQLLKLAGPVLFTIKTISTTLWFTAGLCGFLWQSHKYCPYIFCVIAHVFLGLFNLTGPTPDIQQQCACCDLIAS